MRAYHQRAQGRGSAQRVRRRRLPRPQLAAGVQGDRCLAAHQPAPELPHRRAHEADRSDAVLRNQIMAFVSHGDFGFASGRTEHGGFQRLWYTEPLGPAEVSFDADVFLLTKAKAEALKTRPEDPIEPQPRPSPDPRPEPKPDPKPGPDPKPTSNDSDYHPSTRRFRASRSLEPNRHQVVTEATVSEPTNLSIDLSVTVGSQFAPNMETELRQILNDLGLSERVRIEIRQ